jgi:hypothetical protein
MVPPERMQLHSVTRPNTATFIPRFHSFIYTLLILSMLPVGGVEGRPEDETAKDDVRQPPGKTDAPGRLVQEPKVAVSLPFITPTDASSFSVVDSHAYGVKKAKGRSSEGITSLSGKAPAIKIAVFPGKTALVKLTQMQQESNPIVKVTGEVYQGRMNNLVKRINRLIPTLGFPSELLKQARGSGLQVRVEFSGDTSGPIPGLGGDAYVSYEERLIVISLKDHNRQYLKELLRDEFSTYFLKHQIAKQGKFTDKQVKQLTDAVEEFEKNLNRYAQLYKSSQTTLAGMNKDDLLFLGTVNKTIRAYYQGPDFLLTDEFPSSIREQITAMLLKRSPGEERNIDQVRMNFGAIRKFLNQFEPESLLDRVKLAQTEKLRQCAIVIKKLAWADDDGVPTALPGSQNRVSYRCSYEGPIEKRFLCDMSFTWSKFRPGEIYARRSKFQDEPGLYLLYEKLSMIEHVREIVPLFAPKLATFFSGFYGLDYYAPPAKEQSSKIKQTEKQDL